MAFVATGMLFLAELQAISVQGQGNQISSGSSYVEHISFKVQYIRGQDGQPGSDGAEGATGVKGTPEQRGIPGRPGPPGTEGPQGHQGVSGRRGSDGVYGQAGETGPPGEKGQIGSPGMRGLRGSRGDPGRFFGGRPPFRPPRLVSGRKGQKGKPGIPGALPLPGRTGGRGATGNKGNTGPLGPPGPPGSEGPPGDPGPGSYGGVTYTRWGNSGCRAGVGRIYSGMMGGGSSDLQGGASDYLCLPDDPQYTLPGRAGRQAHSSAYTTDYKDPIVPTLGDHYTPCAVCFTFNSSTVITIPGKTSCPSLWTTEYHGYLMSEAGQAGGRTTFTCVDESMESVPASQGDGPRGNLVHVEANCEEEVCPPSAYSQQKELTCVVCSNFVEDN